MNIDVSAASAVIIEIKGGVIMPTINQLIRKVGKKRLIYKSKSPALGINYNSLKKDVTTVNSPQKEEFVQQLEPLLLKSLIQL